MSISVNQLGYTGVENDDNDDIIILHVDVATKWINTLKKALAETFLLTCLPSWNNSIFYIYTCLSVNRCV